MIRVCLVVVLTAAPAAAGEAKNEVLAVGDAAPAWKDLPGVDGKAHSLADFKDKDVVVVCFTCNSCPIAADYEDRIVAFAKEHAKPDSKAAFVAINVNAIPEDRLEAMKKKADRKKFPFPYLYDATQQVAKDYGAKYTPEFFVLDKARKVAYMGAMDEKSPPAEGGTNYLEAAVTAVLKGEKPAKAEALARGCMIRFVKKRD